MRNLLVVVLVVVVALAVALGLTVNQRGNLQREVVTLTQTADELQDTRQALEKAQAELATLQADHQRLLEEAAVKDEALAQQKLEMQNLQADAKQLKERVAELEQQLLKATPQVDTP